MQEGKSRTEGGQREEHERSRRVNCSGNFLMSELRNSAARSHCPTFTRRGESDTVVVVVVKRFPGRTVVLGKIGTGRPYRDPPIFRPRDARAKGKLSVDESPCFAAVGGDRCGRARVVGFTI